MEKFEWKSTIRMNILTLKLVGLWPKSDKLYQFDFYTLYGMISAFFFVVGSILCQVIHIVRVHPDLEVLTGAIFIILTETLGSIKMCYFMLNRKLIMQLMKTLNSEMFRVRTLSQRRIVQPAMSFWKLAYVSFYTLTTATAFLWSIFPFLDQSFKEKQLPFPAWYPYDAEKSPLYEISYFHQVLGLFLCALGGLNSDTLMAAFMMFVGAQCDILCDNLRNLAMQNFNRNLLLYVNHHKVILSFAENCNKFSSVIVLGQFFTSSVTIGLAMFQLSLVNPLSSESYTLLFFESAVTVQLLLYCWFGNEVEIK
ncbi:7tm 6 domain containing protein, partial [Asbolus verrucosus]